MGFGAEGLRLMVKGFGLRVWASETRARGFGLKVWGFEFRVGVL